MRDFAGRTLIFVLIVAVLLGWLSARPADPERILNQLASISCPNTVSVVPETLVPPGNILSPEEWPRPQQLFAATPLPTPTPFSLAWRMGVSVPDGNPFFFDWKPPRPGLYLNWSADDRAAGGSLADLGMEFMPMVRLNAEGLDPDVRTLYRLAQDRPGRTWLIGNEPDVRWQGDASPDEYACLYFQAYHTIKLADPTAQVANGGISQITPLRLRYLEAVWASYREQFGASIPVDIWNMHAFVLREEEGNWGVGIPPGFDGATDGLLWDVEDHDNLTLVEEQIRRMRAWMATHGQRDKALYITEYGILIPIEFGFTPSRVVKFMVGSFDLFTRSRDPEIGDPADDNRLVQRWVWFSTRDRLYPTGDLFTAHGAPLPPMRAMTGYLRAHSK